MVANLNYDVITVPPHWYDSRETHKAVAMAIHAIADKKRTPEAIWEAPTAAEYDHVVMAVQQFVEAGIVEAEDDGKYPWGLETIIFSETAE